MGKDIKPWDCPKCGAKVFVANKIHEYLCRMYQEAPELAKSTHKVYNVVQFSKAKKKSEKEK
jgi:hypothetical protein